ncbi:MAG: DUF362 domain-containing protein [Myxococcales bacterium]|nr:DUF362 domain-containing protein [Myxococcales bacterium]MBL0198154.1 DUF362 domain-containing protein [Myxococcales bacterium]HQY63129.1 DUF362 domain-containing protein [Polyangiaceae bacterium]
MANGKDLSRRDVLIGGLALAVPLAAACSSPDPVAGADAAPGPTPPTTGTTPLPPPDAATADATPPDATPADATPPDAGDASSPDAGTPVVGGPGVVVEITHCGAVAGAVVQAGPVRAIMARGMTELTGRATEDAAWKALFAPGDVVGIKVSPVGYPKVFSQVATVAEIVRGLGLAGVTPDKIVVFDRYRDYLDACGYAAALPAGVRFAAASPAYALDQTGTAGYDTGVFVDLPRVSPGDDAANPVKRRSHLCDVVSREVTKIINVPALKDHASAGITCALKNMTYGCVNNVSRTHSAPDNWTKDFVPAVASIPALRSKVVLHIADALIACFEGGPAPDGATFRTFVHASLFFATDPVALDRVGWKLLDEQRAKVGLPALANTGIALTNPGGAEAYNERQPQHVLTAGAAGLGISDLARITHRKVLLSPGPCGPT